MDYGLARVGAATATTKKQAWWLYAEARSRHHRNTNNIRAKTTSAPKFSQSSKLGGPPYLDRDVGSSMTSYRPDLRSVVMLAAYLLTQRSVHTSTLRATICPVTRQLARQGTSRAMPYKVLKKLRTYLQHQSPPTKPPIHHHNHFLRRRMDPAELRRVFQMFDRNGDGRITKKELNDSLENMGIFIPDPELTQMIEKIDVNGDGFVDIDEFGALYQSIVGERDEDEDMREAFNVFDQNGDGFITVDELRSVLASLGLKQGRTMEDCKRMIMKVDVDGDGMVNFIEFKEMMRAGGFAA
ncbi:ARF-GAP domain 11 [Actinidia rufa]|uniref:ARF-GAP domain 11 n=1 Tax=Actinidia rufa TaxID=165716 RepID=A0A7J0GJ96_9ERIC|nr:ARF-GAP domain 11 [Actinidia rufa]